MSATTQFHAERAELDAVLESGVFNRATGLANFLRYVCQRYFEGQGDQIKEYNIAVEALGRPPEFDQRKDSIVRVEAHRLRKRLREYYAGAGATHDVQIVIPQGQYIPRFVAREPYIEVARLGVVGEPVLSPDVLNTYLAPPETEPLDSEFAHEVLDSPHPSLLSRTEPANPARWNRSWIWAIATVGALLLACAFFWIRLSAVGAVNAVMTVRPGSEVRIMAGYSGPPFVDQQGRLWWSDQFFHGGAAAHSPHQQPIFRTQDPAIYRNQREGNFSYDIPLSPGIYELHLYFAETVFGEGNQAGGGEASRLFDIKVNGKDTLVLFDVLSDAGAANTVEEKVFRDVSPAADGKLHIAFVTRGHDSAFLNALRILPGIAGKIRPIRITARPTPFTDSEGRVWDADRDFFGGSAIQRSEPVKMSAHPQLYSGERFGNFSYSIPVPPGKYGVTFKFTESYFGPTDPGGGGANSRLFDVYWNGTALLRNFDLFSEAGGSHRALDKVFHGLQPNAQGKLVFQFVPVKNYACISGLEVVDESDAP